MTCRPKKVRPTILAIKAVRPVPAWPASHIWRGAGTLRDRSLILIIFFAMVGMTCSAEPKMRGSSGAADELILGDQTSEKAHRLVTTRSSVVKGGHGPAARILLPPPTANWSGGKLSFSMKVDPDEQNYITVKFDGSETAKGRLNLVCEGMQVGYRHQGDLPMLDIGTDGPMCYGRFYYTTLPIPMVLTRGKKEVAMEIRAQGEMSVYSGIWEQYQKDMDRPSRKIYAVYAHVASCFMPVDPDRPSEASITKKRTRPGIEVLEKLKLRVNADLTKLIGAKKTLTQPQMQFLAKAYTVKWSVAYRDQQVVKRLIESLDTLYFSYKKRPELAHSDPSTWNPDWFGMGMAGQVIHLMHEPFRVALEQQMTGPVIRKVAYGDMLLRSRSWHERHRRQYTNQSMINDLYGIYYSNKGLHALASADAAPEKQMLEYLYQSLGIRPWLGSIDDSGGFTRPLGEHYMQFTPKGLTKELGFVGNYGEILDWVSEIYDATRPAPDLPGDTLIRKRIVSLALARAPYRYPETDDEGYRAMRAEVEIGWRDLHFPGEVLYTQRASADGSPLQIATLTEDIRLVGAAQMMLEDHQFFNSVERQMGNKGLRASIGLLPEPDQYDKLLSLPKSSFRLPLSPGAPDGVHADEDDGTVAIKNGNEYFFASLYWRARWGINHLARVHYVTPNHIQMATVAIKEEFEPQGGHALRADHTNFGFGNGGFKYPDSLHLAGAGEKLPIAKIPEGIPFKPGQENPYAGRANYYELVYGRYFVAMNASDKKRTVKVPEDFAHARVVGTKDRVRSGRTFTLAPMSTIALFN